MKSNDDPRERPVISFDPVPGVSGRFTIDGLEVDAMDLQKAAEASGSPVARPQSRLNVDTLPVPTPAKKSFVDLEIRGQRLHIDSNLDATTVLVLALMALDDQRVNQVLKACGTWVMVTDETGERRVLQLREPAGAKT